MVAAVRIPPAIAETPDPEPSPEIAGERIIRHLGSGSMGDVYELELEGGERVAVKYLSAGLAAVPEALEAFRAEAWIARRLNDPRCVRVLAYEEDPPRIIMELMEGRTLKDSVAEQGPLPPEVAVRYTIDLLEGLSAVHQLGVIHRDVKPANCFLTGDDRVKLGDFGLSSEFDRNSNDPPLGTVLFSSHLLDEVERVADRVAIIHEGKIMLAASMDEIKENHRRMTLRFQQPLTQAPKFVGSLSCDGDGPEWTYVCSGESGQLRQAAHALGATVVSDAAMSLDEIFVTRVTQ
jgi:serine/threonine protein kinase